MLTITLSKNAENNVTRNTKWLKLCIFPLLPETHLLEKIEKTQPNLVMTLSLGDTLSPTTESNGSKRIKMSSKFIVTKLPMEEDGLFSSVTSTKPVRITKSTPYYFPLPRMREDLIWIPRIKVSSLEQISQNLDSGVIPPTGKHQEENYIWVSNLPMKNYSTLPLPEIKN